MNTISVKDSQALLELVRAEAFKTNLSVTVEQNAYNFAEKIFLFAQGRNVLMPKLLEIYDRMLDANSAVKAAYPADWLDRMSLYKKMIVEEAKADKNIVLAAAVLADRYMENENSRMWIYATAVEMIEG